MGSAWGTPCWPWQKQGSRGMASSVPPGSMALSSQNCCGLNSLGGNPNSSREVLRCLDKGKKW